MARYIREILSALVPDLSLGTYRNILKAGQWSGWVGVEININQQVINAVESTIIQNVNGTINLGSQAKELLALIESYGGEAANSLRTAVYEIEDENAPPAQRRAAKKRLKEFLRQVRVTARDVAIDLFEKYLESKMGI
jgi:hypothetical protein